MEHHESGTNVVIEGPRFSSKAESKMFQLWGGDIINMTAVPEVVLANEAGLCYAAIAMVTDYDCWRDDHEPVGCGLSGGWWGYLEFDTLTPFQTKMCSSRKYSFSTHRRFFVYHLLTPQKIPV